MRRRNYIKSVAAVPAIGVGTVKAKSEKNDKPIPASEVGIEDKIGALLREGEIKKSHSLLEKHNIRYTVEKKSKPLRNSQSSADNSTDGPSTLGGVMREGSADVYCTLVHIENQRYLATGNLIWEEGDKGVWGSADSVPDVCGFDFNSSVWASPDTTRDNLWISASDPHEIKLDDYEPEEGVSCEVDVESYDNNVSFKDLTINVQTHVEHIGSNENIPITFVYRHTKGWTPFSRIKGINIGSYLGLNLSTGAEEVWDHPAKADASISDI